MDERALAEIRDLREQYATLPPSETEYTNAEFMLPCRDGARLRTLVYLPIGDGPFPAVVQRSCYAQAEPIYRENGAAYASRGMGYVCQFCRGVGGSEGRWTPNENDRSDGSNLMSYLQNDSRIESIGYYGSSYLAFTGWVIADILPDKVKTLYLTHYGTDRFTSAYQRGLFRQDMLTSWAFQNTGGKPCGDYLSSARYRPQVCVDEDVWKVGELKWYRSWITNTSRNDAYWNEGFWRMLKDIPGKVNLPVYIGSSWYDHHFGSTLETWKALSPRSRERSTLRIGAWNHAFYPCMDSIKHGNLNNYDALNAFSWFKSVLIDGIIPKPSVRYYRVGQDEWCEADGYPFTGRDYVSYELTANGGLIESNAPCGEISYIYDPDDPVLSHGAESVLYHIDEAGVRKQPGVNWRKDVVSFVSDFLDRDMDITGKILLELSVSSTAPDTAFTAKLMEVFPNGEAYNIRSGVTTLAFRNSSDADRATYIPGRRVTAKLDMWDVAWRVSRGSCLRLDISSSDWPQFCAHTNTRGVWALQKDAQKAEQTLYFGGRTGCRVIIPVEKEKTI